MGHEHANPMKTTRTASNGNRSERAPAGRGHRRGNGGPVPDVETLVDWYRRMVLVRRFEEEAGRAFRRGKIGGYLHLYTGQEAVATGFLAAARADDIVFTAYRDHLAERLARRLHPAGFAFVMATGIIGVSARLLHISVLPAVFAAVSAISMLSPFLSGATVACWGAATWWLPWLAVLTVRHGLRRAAPGSTAEYWAFVFPLGMYSAATHQLGAVFPVPVQTGLGAVFLVAALAAWMAGIVVMLHRAADFWRKAAVS
jgi:Voltage-dependent anion channel/Dehydrogenase E1 component